MDAEKLFYELYKELYDEFKAQDPGNENFDVVFEFDGKKLYANKYTLCLLSTTFKSMLSERWTKPDEPIEIKDYKFEEFKEFLIFLYSGNYQFTHENISAMVDIAEFYNVTVFKKACDNYLTNIVINLSNVYQMIEVANKYSLEKLKESINCFVSQNLSTILKSEQFQGLEKSVVQNIVESSQETLKHDELFEAVYKWAENRAAEKLKNDINFNLNESIKEDLSDFLPFINLQKMNVDFIIEFVVQKSFLFSGDDLSDALSAHRKCVKITDENGKKMTGELQCMDTRNVTAAIQSQKNLCCNYPGPSFFCWWRTRQPKPSTASKLFRNDKISWYLVYDLDGDLAIKHRCLLDDRYDYLLAELFAENGFQLSTNCKINVCLFD